MAQFVHFLISPYSQIPIVFGALFLIYFFKKKYFYALLTVSFLYFLVIGYSPLAIELTENLEQTHLPPKAITAKQAIVVLAGGITYYDRKINQYHVNSHLSRILEAIRLYKQSRSEILVLSGVSFRGMPSHMEPEVVSMKKMAMEAGILEYKIFLESKSINTYENGVLTAEILKEKNIKDFYLVTSAGHMKRSMLVFQKQRLNPTPYPVAYLAHPGFYVGFWPRGFDNFSLFYAAIREYIGILSYRILGRI